MMCLMFSKHCSYIGQVRRNTVPNEIKKKKNDINAALKRREPGGVELNAVSTSLHIIGQSPVNFP